MPHSSRTDPDHPEDQPSESLTRAEEPNESGTETQAWLDASRADEARERSSDTRSYERTSDWDGPADTPKKVPPRTPTIPGYEVLGIVGRGGMGVVYKARHLALKRLVALKMILGGGHADPEHHARFRGEAEAVARLQHPNIVQIYEVGEIEGHPFCSLEFVEGRNLAEKIGNTPHPPEEAARLVRTLASAMDAAHDNGVIHRDLKPANVLLASDGEPKITDFGLAKQLDDESGRTQTGAIMGTPSYMAPEQARGQLDAIGAETDVYSLGAILYDLLTGRPPFKGATIVETLDLVRNQEPVPPTHLQPLIPRDLETICTKSLDKEPARRYRSAQALAEDLERFLNNQPILARRASLIEIVWKWAKRRPTVASLVVVVFASLLGVLALSLWYNARLDSALDDTEHQRRIAVDKTEVAEQQSRRATENWNRAEGALSKMRLQLYALQTKSAYDYWNSTNPNVARSLELLNAQRPGVGEPDLRHFEWHYLWRLCHNYQSKREDTRFAAHLPDGARLILSGMLSPKLLWSKGDEIVHQERVPSDAGSVSYAALSPRGDRLALWGFGQRMVVTELPKSLSGSSGLHFRRLDVNDQYLHKGCWSADSRYLFVNGSKGLNVWDVGIGQKTEVLDGPFDDYSQPECSPVENLLAIPDTKRAILLFDTETRKLVGTLQNGHSGKVTALAFSPDGKRLLSAGLGRGVAIWDLATKRRLRGISLAALQALPSSASFSPDGKAIAIGTTNSFVLHYHLDSKKLQLYKGLPNSVSSVSFSPDGKELLARSFRETRVWRVDDDPLFEQLEKIQANVTSIDYSPDGQWLAYGSLPFRTGASGQLVVRNTSTREVLHRFDIPVTHLDFSPDSKTIAISNATTGLNQGGDGRVTLWDVKTATTTHTISLPNTRVHRVVYSGPNRLLLGGEDGIVYSWDLKSNSVEFELSSSGVLTPIQEMVVDEQNTTLLARRVGQKIVVWDLESREVRKESSANLGSTGMAISSKGDVLAWGTPTPSSERKGALDPAQRRQDEQAAENHIDLVDGRTFEVRFTLYGHTNQVRCMVLSADGKRLLTCGKDRKLKIWDVTTGHELASLSQPPSWITAVALSPDGRELTTASADGGVYRWSTTDPTTTRE